MKKKLEPLELQKSNQKRKWKEVCDECKTSQYDCHGYQDLDAGDDLTYLILCPECAIKLKEKGKIQYGKFNPNDFIRREPTTSGRETCKEEKRIKSEGDEDSSNVKNVSEDKGQLLHSGVSRREKSTEHNIGRTTKYRKTTLI